MDILRLFMALFLLLPQRVVCADQFLREYADINNAPHVSFSPDGTYFLAAVRINVVQFSVDAVDSISTFDNSKYSEVYGLAHHPAQVNRFVANVNSRAVRFWSVADNNYVQVVIINPLAKATVASPNPAAVVAYWPFNSSRVWARSELGYFAVCDATGVIATYPGRNLLAFLPDDATVYATEHDYFVDFNTVYTAALYSTSTGLITRVLNGTTVTGPVTALASCAADPDRLLGGTYIGDVYVWSVATGVDTHHVTGLGSAINAITCNPLNADQFLAADASGVRLWDISGKVVRTFLHSEVFSIALDPKNASRFVTSGASVLLWEFPNNAAKATQTPLPPAPHPVPGSTETVTRTASGTTTLSRSETRIFKRSDTPTHSVTASALRPQSVSASGTPTLSSSETTGIVTRSTSATGSTTASNFTKTHRPTSSPRPSHNPNEITRSPKAGKTVTKNRVVTIEPTALPQVPTLVPQPRGSPGSRQGSPSDSGLVRSRIIITTTASLFVLALATLLCVLLHRRRSRSRDEESLHPAELPLLADVASATTSDTATLTFGSSSSGSISTGTFWKAASGGFLADPVATEQSLGTVEDRGTVWRISASVLGQGGFATVFLGINEITAELVAVKRIEVTMGAGTRDWKEIRQEVTLLSAMQHPHVVRYLGSNETATCLFIVLEYVAGGSLHNIVEKFGGVPAAALANVTRQIVSGLVFLHKIPLTHRDIKPRNVLITSDGIAKLTDFGISTGQSSLSTATFKGSYRYAAPEMALENIVSNSVDIWALGFTVLEALTTLPPWDKIPLSAPVLMFLHALNSQQPSIPEDHRITPPARDFIVACLQRDRNLRPSAEQLVHHQFLKPISSQ
eukprot:TRINITY_DN40429_c0_g1_i2.p1 TRINITY_DN40429_c0_g1~~TRINITY_DN40429_c0_g1_i2.p1  ORF type:complete len:857 (+),score=116.16 TRINITY_DN40429_c0_g1_i2:148-2718(+)